MTNIIILDEIINNIKKKVQEPTRKGFGEGLLLSAKQNTNIYGLSADLTESTYMHLFRDAFPDRFIEIGVAEQNMAAVASGIAAMGKLPIIASYAMFSPGRNWEQIRTTICYNNQKVIIGGFHSGLSVGPDGGSHQALEDIAIMRVLPNMTILIPSDSVEAKAMIQYATTNNIKTPIYIRLTREKTPIFHENDYIYNPNKIEIIYQTEKINAENYDYLFIATGPILFNAIEVANILEKQDKKIIILNVHCIKPFDKDTFIQYAKISNNIICLEEHQKTGGLYSLISETLTEYMPKKAISISVNDKYGQSGTPEELFKEYELDIQSILNKIKED